jgi:hypothetical protein
MKPFGLDYHSGIPGTVRPGKAACSTGGSPAWVIVSREPSIEPCGVTGNRRVDA